MNYVNHDKISKDLSAKYYQNNKRDNEKSFLEVSKSF